MSRLDRSKVGVVWQLCLPQKGSRSQVCAWRCHMVHLRLYPAQQSRPNHNIRFWQDDGCDASVIVNNVLFVGIDIRASELLRGL